MTIILKPVTIPDFGIPLERPAIPVATYESRCKIAFEKTGADWLIVYADREHCANISFLTGFEPRFEEALLLLGPYGRKIVITGNENQGYTPISPLPDLETMLCQSLSLMGQDRTSKPNLVAVLNEAGLKAGGAIGLAGWKYLEASEWDGEEPSFFVPSYIVASITRVIGKDGTLSDATSILMHPERGLRAIVDVDQIAEAEWAATRASAAVWRIVSGFTLGDSELSAAARMGYAGEAMNCHPMLATNDRSAPVIGLRSPTARVPRRGDGATTAISFWGGLTARAGLLTDHDEWMHSPIRPGSGERIASGMPFQVDIIPVPMPNGWALNCEDAVTFADATLRSDMAVQYPDITARFDARRAYMKNSLGIEIGENMLPLSNIPLSLAPFWLSPTMLLARD